MNCNLARRHTFFSPDLLECVAVLKSDLGDLLRSLDMHETLW